MKLAKIPATLEKRHSEKKGSDYYVVVLKLSATCEKTIFLEPAETELLLLQISTQNANSNISQLEEQ